MDYPAKVQRVLRAIERVTFMPWQDVKVEERATEHGILYHITAIRPGGIFTEEHLQLFVHARQAYTIEGTDIRMRSSQTFSGGTVYRFGGDVQITGWQTLYRIG